MDELESLAAIITTAQKPKITLISDPAQIIAIVAKGKYRPHLRFYTWLGTSLLLFPEGT
jgi:hypothetical protein